MPNKMLVFSSPLLPTLPFLPLGLNDFQDHKSFSANHDEQQPRSHCHGGFGSRSFCDFFHGGLLVSDFKISSLHLFFFFLIASLPSASTE